MLAAHRIILIGHIATIMLAEHRSILIDGKTTPSSCRRQYKHGEENGQRGNTGPAEGTDEARFEI